MRHALAFALLVVTSGCGTWERRVNYPNTDLVIVTTDEKSMQDHCFRPGQLHDSGIPVTIREQIGACYDRAVKQIWLAFNRPGSIIHELCHYFCDKDTDVKECDHKCDQVHH